MHVAYHTIACTLHRFSVPSPNMSAEPQGEGSPLPSWDPPADFLQKSIKTCFEHAKAISTIMAEVLSRSDCIVTAPFLGFAVFTANLFHLHQAFEWNLSEVRTSRSERDERKNSGREDCLGH